jgi:hypothetical protein
MIAESPANKGLLRPAVNWGLVELTAYDPTPSGGGAGNDPGARRHYSEKRWRPVHPSMGMAGANGGVRRGRLYIQGQTPAQCHRGDRRDQ